MGYPAFWPITLLQSVVVLFRCKDNIAPKYCRYCGPSTGRREYSNTGDLFHVFSDSSGEEEPEEPWLVGRSRGFTLGKSPALVPRVRRFSCPGSK